MGELLADSTLESDYILLQLWLHQPRDGEWKPPTWSGSSGRVAAILDRQLPDGGFNIYPAGPPKSAPPIKAYCALKLAGLSAESEPLRRARDSASWRWAACRRPTATSRST